MGVSLGYGGISSKVPHIHSCEVMKAYFSQAQNGYSTQTKPYQLMYWCLCV